MSNIIENEACKKKGGFLVRGAVQMVCVKGIEHD